MLTDLQGTPDCGVVLTRIYINGLRHSGSQDKSGITIHVLSSASLD